MDNNTNYWIVGANWKGVDQSERFYLRGYWEMGYADEDQPEQAERRNQIKAGDRIAIKNIDGRGSNTITIKALGIVKDVEDKKVYVDWKITHLNRSVYSNGLYATIHGPFKFEGEWLHKIFCL